jgi:hypothetical protein
VDLAGASVSDFVESGAGSGVLDIKCIQKEIIIEYFLENVLLILRYYHIYDRFG